MDHTVPALCAAVTAMNEVVIPAVDPAHPLAREQATIVSGLLAMLVERVPHLHSRTVFEATHYRGIAAAVAADAAEVSRGLADELDALSSAVDALVDSAATPTPHLQEATSRLAQGLSALVRAAGRSDRPAARRIEVTVLDRSGALLDAQRSWFLPQGWESDPSTVPPLADALAVPRDPS
jgi:hypothetical protein